MPDLSHEEARDFLYEEAAILDGWRLDDWLDLFTEDGIYWLPVHETKSADENTSLIYDIPVRREERVFRLMQTPVPSQEPRSRTIHAVTNVRVRGADASDQRADAVIDSYQAITELRSGDFRQKGLGEQRTFVGRCEHHVRRQPDGLKIALKKLVLINRDISIRNLTFIA